MKLHGWVEAETSRTNDASGARGNCRFHSILPAILEPGSRQATGYVSAVEAYENGDTTLSAPKRCAFELASLGSIGEPLSENEEASAPFHGIIRIVSVRILWSRPLPVQRTSNASYFLMPARVCIQSFRRDGLKCEAILATPPWLKPCQRCFFLLT